MTRASGSSVEKKISSLTRPKPNLILSLPFHHHRFISFRLFRPLPRFCFLESWLRNETVERFYLATTSILALLSSSRSFSSAEIQILRHQSATRIRIRICHLTSPPLSSSTTYSNSPPWASDPRNSKGRHRPSRSSLWHLYHHYPPRNRARYLRQAFRRFAGGRHMGFRSRSSRRRCRDLSRPGDLPRLTPACENDETHFIVLSHRRVVPRSTSSIQVSRLPVMLALSYWVGRARVLMFADSQFVHRHRHFLFAIRSHLLPRIYSLDRTFLAFPSPARRRLYLCPTTSSSGVERRGRGRRRSLKV